MRDRLRLEVDSGFSRGVATVCIYNRALIVHILKYDLL
jgi:hypothetical protein